MGIKNKVKHFLITYLIALGAAFPLVGSSQQRPKMPFSERALLEAARRNIPGFVSVLSYFGISKEKALIAAVKAGEVDAVRTLISSGADVNTIDRGYTPLILAANQGHIDVAKELLKAGAEIDTAGKRGVTALLAAADKGYTDLVTFLLQSGADANRAQENGVTALMAATKKGDLSIIKLLLDAGADPNSVAKSGRTALDFSLSRESNNTEVPYVLLLSGALIDRAGDSLLGGELLLNAVQNGQKEMVDLLLHLGVDINKSVGITEITPLIQAVMAKNRGMAEHLIKAGADVDVTHLGLTLVEIAALKDDSEMIQLLLKNGVRPYPEDAMRPIQLTDEQKKLIDELYKDYSEQLGKALLEESTLSEDAAGLITEFFHGEKIKRRKK